ncbi:MAG: peptide ABC transporter substrate-binding protein [Christensenellaceae bacterium]|nr:peptide ABC transporter substrate-binding protein [Christensenellaceae bacterium]
MRSTMKTMLSTNKKLFAVLIALVLLFSCAMAEEEDDGMTIGIISVTTQYLNPFIAVEREMMSLTDLVYEGLVSIDDDLIPQPNLCKSWEHTKDGDTWYFYLREGITFHDGTPLTANDVVASANTIIDLAKSDAANKGAYASLRYMIDSISANDNLTVVIKTSRKNYGFLYAMNFPVLPASQVQAENPIGTGPYVISRFEPKDFLILSANESWWRGKPKLSSIMAIFHVANRELISSFEYNRVDAIITRSLTAAQYRSSSSSLNMTYRTKQLETLLMNTRARELGDIRVRKAIRYAINIPDILNSVYMDMAQRTDTPMMPGTRYYNEEHEKFQFDPEKAKQLLSEAGWEDSDDDGIRDTVINGEKANLSLRFIVYEEPDNSVRMMAANTIASMLQNVGIATRIDLLSYDDARARLKASNFDLALAAFNMDMVPDPGFLLMTNNTCNYMRYSSDIMDRLFETLRKTMDKDEYRNVLFQIQSLFADDCPFMCLYYRKGAVLTRRLFTDARDIREPEVLRGIAEGVQGIQ